ncbi:MAG TPA: M20/M25/M40 family metallo-hydrolase [Pyrinomonadaceae bacterium]|nr:M20/M25/M40 family metallo-hydrolase [Pyrinomonadaceae bacterium]
MKIKRITSLIAVLLLATVASVAQQPELEPSADKLQQHVSYLASDALDGRRTGTAGANDAARYIAGEFSRLGLRPGNDASVARRRREVMAQYLQTFPYVAGVSLGPQNLLTFGQSLVVGNDWVPLAYSSNGKISGGIVFAGFGITASELNYDDYAGLNATGKIAIALQGTPDGDNPHGQFARLQDPRWKTIAARNAGAKALIIVARDGAFSEDRLTNLTYDNTGGEAGLPVIVISRPALDKILALSNTTISDLEKATTAKTPGTNRTLTGELSLSTDVVRKEVPAYNVVGILEGSDPVLKNEYLVIGAHYDHLGRGGVGSGSLAPRSGEIHHGADDNASGTAGMIELARIFSAQKPKLKRTLVFIGFGGEEEGLLGSNYYVNHPLVPLANTVAMINMDMIGRMRDRKLSIGGIGTAQEWREIVRQANSAQSMSVAANSGSPAPRGVPIVVSANGRPIMTVDPNGTFELTLTEDGYGPSDHSSFYSKQVPVLFFFTGAHNDYHKPSDTFDKINYNDEARILSLVARILRDVDGAPKRLSFTTARSDATQRTGGFRVYLGTIPNYADSNNGLLLDGVRDDSPAAKAGLKAGDRITKIGTREIKNVYDYTYALGEMKAGQEYVVEVMRGSEKLTLKITPEARK